MTRLWIVQIAALLLVGCTHVDRAERGDPISETQAVPLGGAESAKIDIDVGAGEIGLGPGATGLLDAEFLYQPRSMRPVVNSSVASGRAYVTVRQPSLIEKGLRGVQESRWKLKLNEKVPAELRVKVGAGKSVLDLARIPVTRLNVEVGAGELELDLSGPRTVDLDGKVQGGVGGITVRLPTDIGVRVKANQGLGELRAGRLKRQNSYLVNDLYGKTPVDLRLEVTGGVGSLRLVE